jgi:mono/diheme cytochrome c family protein
VVRCRHAIAVVLAMAGVIGVVACGGTSSSGPSGAAPLPTGAQVHDATLLAGRKVFSAECASCHGTHGQGGVGPTFNDGRLLHDYPNLEDQVTFVSKGKGVMPAFAGILTHQQIETVVAYERQVLSRPR